MKSILYELYHCRMKKGDVPENELPMDEKYDEGQKRVGVFSSQDLAEQAIRDMRLKPGFRKFPDGFRIGLVPLDPVGKERGWDEGFFDAGDETDPEGW